jgi:hypothetical protein
MTIGIYRFNLSWYFYENFGTHPWAVSHDAVASNGGSTTTCLARLQIDASGNVVVLTRTIMLADTSNLAGKYLLSARLYGTYDASAVYFVPAAFAGIYAASPVLPLGDLSNYSRMGSALKSDMIGPLPAVYAPNVPFSVAINDLGVISQSGITYLGFRTVWDGEDFQPEINIPTGQFYAAVSVDLYPPTLEVTWSDVPPLAVRTLPATNIVRG